MTRKRVLSFIGYYLPGYKAGGVLRTLSNTVEALRDDVEFYIITRNHDQGSTSAYPNIQPGEWNEIGSAKVYYLNESEIGLFTLFNIIRCKEFDLYHFNSFFDPKFTFLPFVMRFFGLIKRYPMILAPRGEFTNASLAEKKIIKRLLLKTFNFLGFPRDFTWQASSEVEAKQIRSVLDIPFDGLNISPDIPDISTFNLNQTIENKEFKVISLSRIHPTKGTLEAFKIIAKTTAPIFFSVYGPVEDEEYWAQCLEIASNFPQSVTFKYFGSVAYRDVKKVLSNSSLLLLPSPGENYGHVVAESISVGTPVLLSNQTPWNNFEERKLGAILPLDNLDAFAQKIDIFSLQSISERAQLRKDILSVAPEVLNLNHNIEENLKVFNKALHRINLNGPRPYQECINCMMDTSDPFIRFNEEGLCDGCENFYSLIKPNWKNSDESLSQIQPKINEIKRHGKGKKYDCIIGVSGGLDSSYLVYCAVKKLGLRPLLFHCDAGWNTDQAVWNISCLVNGLNLDLYTEVIDWQEMRQLQMAFFESQIPDQDLPQDGAFFSALYKYASKNRIKYVLTGANYSTECSKEPQQWGGYPGIDTVLFKDILKRFGGFKLKSFPLVDILTYKIFYRVFYRMQVVKPLNHMRYIKKEAEETLNTELGWKPFPHKHHESRFTRFYEDFWMPTKFGYDRRRSHFSSLILTNQLTKSEAIHRLSKPFLENEILEREFEYIAHKLEISTSKLRKIYNKKNKTFKNYQNKYGLIIFGSVILRAIGLERRRFR